MDSRQRPDAGISSTRRDTNRYVADVVRQAEQELRELIEQRVRVTKRIGMVKQTIVGLAKMFGEDILNDATLELVERKSGSRQPGVTQACRRVLMEAVVPMSTREVCAEVQRTAPGVLAHHKDPLATIHTILSRLVEYSEATVLSGDRGQRVWLWAAEQDSRSRQVPEGEGLGPAS